MPIRTEIDGVPIIVEVDGIPTGVNVYNLKCITLLCTGLSMELSV